MSVASRARRWLVGGALAGALFFAAAPASAQQSGGGGGLIAGAIAVQLTTYIGVPLTTVGGGITVLLVVMNSADDSKDASTYIYRHSDALKRDLTVGEGATIRQLARMFRVDKSDYGAFADLVQDRRDALVPLTNRKKLNQQRASRFFRTIARGMKDHPRLNDDLRVAGSIPAQN